MNVRDGKRGERVRARKRESERRGRKEGKVGKVKDQAESRDG